MVSSQPSHCQTLNAEGRRAVMGFWHACQCPGHFSDIRASGLPIDIEFPVSPGCDNGPLFAGIISLELWMIWQRVSNDDSSSMPTPNSQSSRSRLDLALLTLGDGANQGDEAMKIDQMIVRLHYFFWMGKRKPGFQIGSGTSPCRQPCSAGQGPPDNAEIAALKRLRAGESSLIKPCWVHRCFLTAR